MRKRHWRMMFDGGLAVMVGITISTALLGYLTTFGIIYGSIGGIATIVGLGGMAAAKE